MSRTRDSAALDPAAADAALAGLLAAVMADPTAFDFFALLRKIDALERELPRTGEALRPRQEALRLAQAPELDFAPAALHRLEAREAGPPRLSVRFFGLLGSMGPMPLHFTEFVRDRLHHHGDATLAHFLDLFHHRLLSLFYRAWAQSQPVVHLDRPREDRYRIWLGALAGAPAEAGALPPAALAFHAGWLADRSRHPERLVKVLRQIFGVQARIGEHVGQWLAIDDTERTHLGHARNRAERSATPPPVLGRTANAGSRVWDRQYRFRLHLGPLTLDQYHAFLPGGTAFGALEQWVRLLAGRELRWDLQLALAPAERPEPRLGKATRLGLTSWLGTRRERPAWRAAPRELRLRPLTNVLLLRRRGVHDA
jgi:type VI secretion system protein ImpH